MSVLSVFHNGVVLRRVLVAIVQVRLMFWSFIRRFESTSETGFVKIPAFSIKQLYLSNAAKIAKVARACQSKL